MIRRFLAHISCEMTKSMSGDIFCRKPDENQRAQDFFALPNIENITLTTKEFEKSISRYK
ncbi:hypothetical protein PZA11_003278 [Diplocarpon coronariae]